MKAYQFTKGNRKAVGQGNRVLHKRKMLGAALYYAATSKQMQRICHALLRQAEEGKMEAIKLVLAYTMGQPAKEVNVTTTGTIDVTASVKAVLASHSDLLAALRVDESALGVSPGGADSRRLARHSASTSEILEISCDPQHDIGEVPPCQ